MPDISFFVHLQSLTDFENELETQLEALQKPNSHLTDLIDGQVQLGNFAEADSLRAQHDQVVGEMMDLLGQVKDAIGFAQQVTGTVATDYQQADDNAANGNNFLSSVTDGIFGGGQNGSGGSGSSSDYGNYSNNGDGGTWT
jgi:hypothetical protein